MYPFKENLFGARGSDEEGTLVGNFANWTVICGEDIGNNICDPTKKLTHLRRFGTPEVYAANYTKWPRREEICEAVAIPIYDSPPYDTIVEASHSFRNFMEGFYIGNETCNDILYDCSINETSRLQLHNQVAIASL